MSGGPTRPVLRYHGGKWRLAPWIISHFPAHRVVNLFRVLRDPASAATLRELVSYTPFAREEYVSAYQEAPDQPVEQARRTLVKAWLGFGSGGLIESSAGLRVALSRNRHTPKEWATFERHFPSFVDRLAGVLIENRPAADVIRSHADDDTLFFVDPPYVATERGSRHRYRFDFTEQEHASLAIQLRTMPGMIVVAGYDSALYDRLYRNWTTVRRDSLDAASKHRTEVLWLNPACVAALETARTAA